MLKAAVKGTAGSAVSGATGVVSGAVPGGKKKSYAPPTWCEILKNPCKNLKIWFYILCTLIGLASFILMFTMPKEMLVMTEDKKKTPWPRILVEIVAVLLMILGFQSSFEISTLAKLNLELQKLAGIELRLQNNVQELTGQIKIHEETFNKLRNELGHQNKYVDSILGISNSVYEQVQKLEEQINKTGESAERIAEQRRLLMARAHQMEEGAAVAKSNRKTLSDQVAALKQVKEKLEENEENKMSDVRKLVDYIEDMMELANRVQRIVNDAKRRYVSKLADFVEQFSEIKSKKGIDRVGFSEFCERLPPEYLKKLKEYFNEDDLFMAIANCYDEETWDEFIDFKEIEVLKNILIPEDDKPYDTLAVESSKKDIYEAGEKPSEDLPFIERTASWLQESATQIF